MFTSLEKHWPTISILLLLTLLACLLFWPGLARPLGLAVLILSVGLAMLFTLQKHVRAYQKGQLDRASTFRNIFVDEFGSLMTIAAAILVAGKIAQAVSVAAGGAAEARWPGAGLTVGILSGLLVGILIGMGIGLLVQLTWGRLVKRPRVVPAENGN